MNDRRTVARPARAERSKLSTLSAPASSLRIARMADVSRTRRFGSGISAAIPSPVVEQSTYGAALPRAAVGAGGMGMIRTAFPSIFHSRAVFGVMPSWRRIADGMDTWPRVVTFVRMARIYHVDLRIARLW